MIKQNMQKGMVNTNFPPNMDDCCNNFFFFVSRYLTKKYCKKLMFQLDNDILMQHVPQILNIANMY